MTKLFSVTIRSLSLLILFAYGLAATAAGGKILVLGDSLSAAYGIPAESGWVQLLEDRLRQGQSGFEVVNASISGDTTRGGLARLPAALQLHQPRWVIIELGGNDGLRGLSLQRLRHNLVEMINITRDAGALPLLVGIKLPANYGKTFAERFHSVFKEVADAQEVPLVPFLLEGVAMQRSLMQADGIHPTAAAQPVMLGNVWPILTGMLGQQTTALQQGSAAAQARGPMPD